jgi:hypothetical protein
MELRVPRASPARRATVRKISAEELSQMLGFEVVGELDRVAEAVVGTRAALLRDEGPRRNQLCVVFRSPDRVVPALVWSLIRAIPLVLQHPEIRTEVSVPRVVRTAPQLVAQVEGHASA